MKHGVVGIRPLGESPGPESVDALVVVERASAQIPEAEDEGGGENGRVGNELPVHLDAASEEAVERVALGGGGRLRRHGDLT